MSLAKLADTTAFLRDAIENDPTAQREITRAPWFAHPNALSMIPNALSMMKTGECTVPISRTPALSAALMVKTKRFQQNAMRESHPEI